MVYRASLDFPFEFGNPDTWDRFWYHVSGQTYMSKFKVSDKSGGEYFMLKLPYYSYLIFRQYICFFPFIILGIVFLIKNKLFKFLTFSALYFGVNMFFQLYRPHEASGDIEGYIVMPFYVFGLIIPYGVYYLARMNKFYWLASFLLIPQIALNLPRVDKSKYDVSESLMQELDRASPQNSVVIISDWTLVIHYYYYRIVNNFRPDLTVLNYDFKFTNYMIVPTLYPEFYKSIQKEYDDFVDELGKEHPPLIYNTGCRLTTTKLLNKFNKVLLKVESLCKENNRTLLFDPKAFYSYGNLVKFRRNVYPSGCLFSLSPTEQGREFINLDMDWIESSILPYDPCATEKLVDFEAALDMHMRHYQKLGDKEGYKQAQESKQKMKGMQKILKRNFPNLFLNEFTIQQNKKKQQKQQSKKGDVYFNPSANPKKN
ncbi:MAG: hypothetical protein JKY33_02155 [Bacteroidia bacterium]|nr:hypothetical protein [Bacteroidia bacterium]